MDDIFLDTANREVLWNLSSPINQIVMYGLFSLSLLIALNGFWKRFLLWSAGHADNSRFSNSPSRLLYFCRDVILQHKVNQDPQAKIFHSLIFLGFLALLFTTTMVFIDHDLGIKIYNGRFYLAVTLLSDLLGLALIVGVAFAYHFRYLVSPDRLHSTKADLFMLLMLLLLCIQGFVLEGLRIHVTGDPWKFFSPVGYIYSLFFWGLSVDSARLLHFAVWWIHAINVFVFIALIPYTKFLHIFTSSANLFFRDFSKPKGALSYPGDIENLLETALESGSDNIKIGVSGIEDLSWKQRLDLDSCTQCGRCQEVCPAYNSGTPLSPKWLILDTRNHMLKLHVSSDSGRQSTFTTDSVDRYLLNSLLLPESSIEHNQPTIAMRASNPLVQNSAIRIGENIADNLAGDVMQTDVFWSCTTCRACMEVCPVGIEHVGLITDVRRSLALIRGEIPTDAQNSLRAIENRGNPFGAADKRSDWTTDLQVQFLEPGAKVDVLYWVGCVSAYDRRKQKIARSLVKILNHSQRRSGLTWGILGNRENCTGDPARRLGEENIFQSAAKKNIQLLQSISYSTIVANCPHCFNTLKNEYSQLESDFLKNGIRVLHHSQLIKEYMDSGFIKVNKTLNQEITFHDPCYLGRYNDTYQEPRDILVQLGSPAREMVDTRNKAMCCGAGGGHFFMDLKAEKRINVQRVDQVAQTGAKVVATGCPFCMQMLEDGTKLTNRDEDIIVRDLAELVADSLEDT